MEETNCKLCGCNRRKIVLTNCQDYLENTPGKFTIAQCNRCGLFYLNPRPTMEELTSCYTCEYYAYQKPDLTKMKKRLSKLKNFPFQGILKERFHYPIQHDHSLLKKALIRFAFCAIASQVSKSRTTGTNRNSPVTLNLKTNMPASLFFPRRYNCICSAHCRT